MRNKKELSKKWGKPCITRLSTRRTKIQRGQIQGSRKIDFINSYHKTAGVGVRGRRLQGRELPRMQKDLTQ